MMGWKACLAKYRLPGLEAEREAAIARWTTDPSDENSATMLLYCDMVAKYKSEGEFVESHWERAAQGEATSLTH